MIIYYNDVINFFWYYIVKNLDISLNGGID